MMLFIFLLGLPFLIIITSFYWRSNEIKIKQEISAALVTNPLRNEEFNNGQIKILSPEKYRVTTKKYVQDDLPNFDPRIKPLKLKTSNSSTEPLILVVSHWGPIWPPQPFNFCPLSRQCRITDKLNEINWSQAKMVIWHFHRGPPYTKEQYRRMEPVFQKTVGQLHKLEDKKEKLLTFLSWESPHYHRQDYGRSRNWFNYTMTYRLDSDLPLPYGTVWSSKVKFKIDKLKKLDREIEKLPKLRGYF